jgi:hypothetical protein
MYMEVLAGEKKRTKNLGKEIKMVDAPTNLTIRQKGGLPQPRPRPPRPPPQQGRETTIFLEGTGSMRVACGGSLSLPLVSDSTRRNVSGRNTTKALQKDFRRLEEIYDQKRHKSLPSVGNFNCLVICSIHFHLNSIAANIFHNTPLVYHPHSITVCPVDYFSPAKTSMYIWKKQS